jgi:predicted nucleic acid-binding protein
LMTSTAVDVLLDTNVLWARSELRSRLIEQCRAGRLRVHLPALVIVERERQLIQRDHERAARGETVNMGRSMRQFRQWVEQLALDLTLGQPVYQVVLAFDREQAQWVSTGWGEWLANLEAEYLCQTLDAPVAAEELRQRFQQRRRGRGTHLPDLDWLMHKADWSIAAVARHTGWLLVTNDRGAPFQQPGVRTMSVQDFAVQYLEEQRL